ncbi:MAG: MFS transporter [Armatimonadota bacterium]|nr:MFS transporter [Armatimonadota bacterium]
MADAAGGVGLPRRSIAAVIALSVVALLAELGYQTTAVAGMPYFLREVFRLRMEQIGLINMAFLVAETGGKVPFAALSDRLGRWPFVVGGPLLSAVAAFGVTQVSSAGWVMALRALDGLGAAMLWPTLFAAIADLVDDRFRATAMSLFNLMYIGGLVLGPLTYSAVFSATGSHVSIFYVLGSLFLACVVVAAVATQLLLLGAVASIIR